MWLWDKLKAVWKAIVGVLKWLRRWYSDFQITVIAVAATTVVFLILLVIQQDLTDDASAVITFVHEHGSDLLMAIIVAFLGLVLWKADHFTRELNRHKTQWEKSCEELRGLEANFSETQVKLDSARENHISSLKLTWDLTKLYDKITEKAKTEVANSILEKSTRLADAWTDYILPERKENGDEVKQYLEQICWQLAFNSYMDEEYRAIKAEKRSPKESPGPILATNYPTYLEFLKEISGEFTNRVRKAGFKPCFLSLANTYPIEWVMISERRRIGEDISFECETNQQLSDWRSMSGKIGKHEESVFRRIFLTADSDAVWDNLPLPRKDVFRDQHDQYVWTTSQNEDTKIGLRYDIWKEIAKKTGIGPMASHTHIRPNRLGVFISDTSVAKKSSCKIEDIDYDLDPPKALKKVVLQDLHKPQYCVTARTTIITKELLDKYDKPTAKELICKHELHPTDLLIVGLLPNDCDLKPKDHLIQMMTPLMGVECRARDRSDISVLSLYSSEHIEKWLKDWICLLEEESTSLQEFLNEEPEAAGDNG